MLKESGEASGWIEVDRHDNGVGWIAFPDEPMQRASHAFVADEAVWLVDPIDVDGIDGLLAEYGDVAGVVVLLDRHKRDCAAIANRHDVAVWVPDFMDDVADELDAPVERFRRELADTGYTIHELYDNPFWQEAILFDRDQDSLYVPEAVGTTDYFCTGSERLGVHPVLRLTPPRKLKRLAPDDVFLGHGAGIHDDAAEALEAAIAGSLTNAPGLLVKNTLDFLPFP